MIFFYSPPSFSHYLFLSLSLPQGMTAPSNVSETWLSDSESLRSAVLAKLDSSEELEDLVLELDRAKQSSCLSCTRWSYFKVQDPRRGILSVSLSPSYFQLAVNINYQSHGSTEGFKRVPCIPCCWKVVESSPLFLCKLNLFPKVHHTLERRRRIWQFRILSVQYTTLVQ